MPDEQPEVAIPKGLGPGDVPEGLSWPRSLWVILPSVPTVSQSETLSVLRTRLRDHVIRVSEIKVQPTKGANGQNFSLIPAKDVAGIYRRAHRARTAVIALCGAKVLLDVSEKPSNKGCVSLERFIRHKCYYGLITRPVEVETTLALAIEWMDGTCCEGYRDPRCFPSAIFETREDYPLNTHDQRQSFIAAHKATKQSNELTDSRERTWQVGPSHTRDLIQVGGCTLPIGFHWDVQAARDSIIVTGWERWRLPGKGYTNVHPDALLRGGSATRTHSALTTEEGQKQPKTPRQARRKPRK